MYVDAARHNDAKPKMGRELMILTHDDDDVCMYVNRLTWTSKVSVGAGYDVPVKGPKPQ